MIKCELCRRYFEAITNSHLKAKHDGMTLREYERMFPNAPLLDSRIETLQSSRISEGLQRYYQVFAGNWTGKRHTETSKLKMSETKLGQQSWIRDSEYCREQSERMSGRFVGEETRQRISDSWKVGYKERCKAISKTKEGLQSGENPDERSERRRQEWTDPEIRARRSASIREAWEDPELRARRSREMKELWRNPAFRKMTLEAQAEGKEKRLTEGELVLMLWVKEYLPSEWITNVLVGKSVAGMIPDFLNEDRKQVIEMFGTFYHDDTWFPNRKSEEETIEAYKIAGYDCIVIWGDEVYVKNLALDKLRKFM